MNKKIKIVLLVILLIALARVPEGFAYTQLKASDGNNGNYFGRSVSFSEQTILVGSPYDNENGEDSGAAYIFEKNLDASWSEICKLTPSDGQNHDHFGDSVALDGDVALVGSPWEHTERGFRTGAAYIFKRNPDNTWSQQAILLPKDLAPWDYFGKSIAVAEDKAVIGAHRGSGAVYVFELNYSGDWVQTNKLTIPSDQTYGSIGNTVAVNGEIIMAGTKYNSTEQGGVYVYERSLFDGVSFELTQKLDYPVEEEVYYYQQIALSTQTAVVIGYKYSEGSYLRIAYIFERDATGIWTKKETITFQKVDSDYIQYDSFSASIEKNTIVFGVDCTDHKPGAVYVYEKDVSGQWELVNTLTAPGLTWEDEFGASVSISENLVVVSAQEKEDCHYEWWSDGFAGYQDKICKSEDPGSVFVFDLEKLDVPVDVTASDGEYTDRVKISWAVFQPNVSYYEIFRDTSPDGTDKINVGSTTETFYEDTDVGTGIYYYWISAVTPLGPGEISQAAAGSIIPLPENVTATALDDEIRISWDPASDDVLFYRIYKSRSQNGNSRYKIGTSKQPFYDDPHVPSCGTAYYYWIVAVYSETESGFSEMVSARRNDCPPTPPKDVTASQGDYENGIRISWESMDEAKWYQVFRGMGATTGRTLISIVTEPFHVDTSVFPSTRYYYQIKAVTEYGISPYSTTSMGYYLDNDGTYQYAEVRIFASDGSNSDFFGKSVAADEDVAFIGATGDREKGSSAGAVYVFEKNKNDLWVQKAKLLASDGQTRDRFGNHVALSGTTALIGTENSGSAYIFEQDDNGTWQQSAILTPPNTSEFHQFGYSMDVSDSTAVIGNYCKTDDFFGDDRDPSGEDMVYVYEKSTDGQWTDITRLSVADGFAFNRFGESVAIFGNTIMVGTPNDDDNGERSGSLYVFEKKPNNIWIQSQKILPSDGSERAKFGYSVAIYGDTALISAIGSGTVYSFIRDENGLWQQVFKKIIPGGQSVIALHKDMAVFGGNYTGEAEVYKLKSYNIWTRVARLLANDLPGNERAGAKQALAISGQDILVGGLEMDCYYLEDMSGVTDGWICNSTAPGSVAIFDIDKVLTPANPVEVSASDGKYKDKIQLTWKRSTDVVFYEIYRSVTQNSEKTKIGQSKSNTFTDSHLAGKTRYFYWLKAIGEFGESDFSTYDEGSILVGDNDNGDTGSDNGDTGSGKENTGSGGGGGCFINAMQSP